MEVTEHALLEIRDASGAGHARRKAADLAQGLGFSAEEIGRLGIVVTETATNLVKHGGGGELLLRTLGSNGTRGVALLALDRGPGFANLAEALRDGYSSSGTPGTGLGAIRRLSTLFDIYSVPGAGAALMATLWPRHSAGERGGTDREWHQRGLPGGARVRRCLGAPGGS